MTYKEWFDELGEKTVSIEKQCFTNENFSSNILEKTILVNNKVIDVFSTTLMYNDFTMILALNNDIDYSLLTRERYTKHELILERLAYFEYYTSTSDWKPDYGLMFERILDGYIFRTDIINIAYLPLESFFPIQIGNKELFKVLLCIPLSDNECDYLRKFGQEKLIQKLKECKADIFDLFRDSCI
ncbi:hypothetical protein [Sulfurimonas sp.]|uniref:hypothetical protein n=1 Tax=Sulfurimonas sp. TaxID=2022749 RepID=UPI003D0A1E42